MASLARERYELAHQFNVVSCKVAGVKVELCMPTEEPNVRIQSGGSEVRESVSERLPGCWMHIDCRIGYGSLIEGRLTPPGPPCKSKHGIISSKHLLKTYSSMH